MYRAAAAWGLIWIFKIQQLLRSSEVEATFILAASSTISLHNFARWVNLRRMLGSIVVSAVRWHTAAFLRQSRIGSVSLDNPSQVSYARHMSQQNAEGFGGIAVSSDLMLA